MTTEQWTAYLPLNTGTQSQAPSVTLCWVRFERSEVPPMTVDLQVQEWLQAERDAETAEAKVAQLGQGAADPRVAALFKEAFDLRQKADALFADVRHKVQR